MEEFEKHKNFKLFLEGSGIQYQTIIPISSLPLNITMLELIISSIIAFVGIYLFSSVVWLIVFLVIYWFCNVIKYFYPFPEVSNTNIIFDTKGIEQDKKHFWAWEEITNVRVNQIFPVRKQVFFDFIPSYARLFRFLIETVSKALILYLSQFKFLEHIDFNYPLFPKRYYTVSFDTPESTETFILEEDYISKNDIIPDYFERYKQYHKIRKEVFNL